MRLPKDLRILGGSASIASIVVLSLTIYYSGILSPFSIYGRPLQPPSPTHIFGTDALGRDVFARACLGTLISLQISILGTLIAFAIGLPMGVASSLYKGTGVDEALMRVVDSLLSFPTLILVLFISATFGQDPLLAALAIGVAESPIVARLSRGAFISVLSAQFVEAARALGAGRSWIVWRYMLPHSREILMAHFTLTLSTAIILESGLSFLGLSTRPPYQSLGAIVREGFLYIDRAWWYPFFPSIVLIVMILAINLLGDGINDRLDPRYRLRTAGPSNI